MRRRIALVVALGLLLTACGRLGVGVPGCETVVRDPSTAIILSLQAVPTAEYAPCVNELKFGWNGPHFQAESGLAETWITNSNMTTFLTASLTESCDIGDAIQVASTDRGVERFEDIETIEPELIVTIIPSGESSVAYARDLVDGLRATEIRERLVLFRIDADESLSVGDRIDRAFQDGEFVWLVGELDAEEGTLELRSSAGVTARGVSVDTALDRMEDVVEEVVYRGNWYLRFEGGCITYEFRAKGRLAETIAADAAAAFGLYPLDGLREIGENLGYEIVPAE